GRKGPRIGFVSSTIRIGRPGPTDRRPPALRSSAGRPGRSLEIPGLPFRQVGSFRRGGASPRRADPEPPRGAGAGPREGGSPGRGRGGRRGSAGGRISSGSGLRAQEGRGGADGPATLIIDSP